MSVSTVIHWEKLFSWSHYTLPPNSNSIVTSTDIDLAMSLSTICNIKFNCILKFWLWETKANMNYVFNTLWSKCHAYYVFSTYSNTMLLHKSVGFTAIWYSNRDFEKLVLLTQGWGLEGEQWGRMCLVIWYNLMCHMFWMTWRRYSALAFWQIK